VFSARGRAVCRRLGVGAGFLTLSDEDGLVVAVAVLMRADGAAAQRARASPKATRRPKAKRKAKSNSPPKAKRKAARRRA
jgi:hypothetical protein